MLTDGKKAFKVAISLGIIIFAVAIKYLIIPTFDLSEIAEAKLKLLMYVSDGFLVLFISGLWINNYRNKRKNVKETEGIKNEVEELRIKDEARDDYWAISMHGVQNTQDGLINLARMLLERASLSTDAKSSLYMILTSGKRVRNMLSNIAGYSGKAGKKQKINLVPTSINDIVDFVIKMLGATSERNMKLINAIPRDFDKIMADESLEQAIMDIVGNAIKFTHEGELRIEVEEVTDEFAHIVFKDNGRGISQESLEKLNVAMQRELQKLDPDLGIGLNIVKRVIKGHGGNVWLESELDRGTKVHITLPIAIKKDLGDREKLTEKEEIEENDKNKPTDENQPVDFGI